MKYLRCFLIRFITVTSILLFPASVLSSTPLIDIWYGPEQSFGDIGQPHEWINILGKASDPHGLASLTYSLNGQAESPLSVGPDSFRNWNAGDFNVEIAYSDLQIGENSVVITATDSLGNQGVKTVTLHYPGVRLWPRSYSIDWASVANINDVAQVTDGLWLLENAGVRTQEIGYDRLIAVGDISWDNYEITVPITVHGLNPICEGDITGGLCGGGPKVGVLARWQGHFSQTGEQPAVGWQRLGAIGWLGWRSHDLSIDYLGLMDADGNWYNRLNQKDFPFEVPHILKLRAETGPASHTFSIKAWRQGQAEPATWDIVGVQPLQANALSQGSLLLVAHHVDASFGNVNVMPLTSDTSPPTISNIQLAAGRTAATVSWTTNELANSRVEYGPSSLYEYGTVSADFMVTDHRITLEGLAPNTGYHYRINSVDAAGNAVTTSDRTFSTSDNPAGIVSDLFDGAVLDTGIWNFLNPAGDASSVSMTGSQLAISVPGGTSHDIWQNENLAPRIMQPALDRDFDIKAKFDSPVTQQFQIQGMLVEQDSKNLIRADIYSDGTDTRIFAATFSNGIPTVRLNSVISAGTSVSLRIVRLGNQWSLLYSPDENNWLTAGSFSHQLTVSAVGLFAANAGSSPPAHTALVDHFVVKSDPASEPPAIIAEPVDQTVQEGQSATFSVTASGSEPLSYLWQKNGVDIPGVETASFSTGPTTLADDGSNYRVVVSNASGTIISNTATLSVSPKPSTPPTIVTEPAPQTVFESQTATFTVVAEGTGPLSYQWEKNGTVIAGANSASYTTPPTTAANDNGTSYRVRVSNSAGSVISTAATLTVNLDPAIITQPEDQSVVEGDTATFTVVASGSTPFSYQWQKDSVDITGANGPSFTTQPTTVASHNGASYRVIVSNAAGSVTSSAATLLVTAAPVPVTITRQPENQTVNPGNTATFSVAAGGTTPLRYQWKKNDLDIAGANSSSYTTAATTASDNGASFRVVVSNPLGSVSSAAAILSVNQPESVASGGGGGGGCTLGTASRKDPLFPVLLLLALGLGMRTSRTAGSRCVIRRSPAARSATAR